MQRHGDLRRRAATFGRFAGYGLPTAADFGDISHAVLPTSSMRFAAEAGPPQRDFRARQSR